MKVSMLVLTAAMLAAGAAQASDDGKALLQKSGCTACHSEDKKLVGPAYKDVAAKYKGDAERVEHRRGEVGERHGVEGGGHWLPSS